MNRYLCCPLFILLAVFPAGSASITASALSRHTSSVARGARPIWTAEEGLRLFQIFFLRGFFSAHPDQGSPR